MKEIPIGNLTDSVSFCEPIMRELNALMEFSLSESGDEALRNFVWTATAKRTALLAGKENTLVKTIIYCYNCNPGFLGYST